MRWSQYSCWFLATSLTLLNAAKPLHMDDAFYFRIASQIATHPLDPYGCDVYWHQTPVPAHAILNPLVVSYWWGLGKSLFGDQPVLWKCWLFPFALLYAWALHALGRRFVPSHAMAVSWLVACSPLVLPSFNYMLDVPVQALGLASLAVLLCAVESGQARALVLAVLTGLMGGLAMQTKYTAVIVIPGLFLAVGWSSKRWLQVIVALFVALALFTAWEFWLSQKYGTSHFLSQMSASSGTASFARNLLSKTRFVLPLFTLMGATAGAVALLAVPGRSKVLVALLVVALPFLLLIVPSECNTNHLWERVLFFIVGIGWWLLLAYSILQVLRGERAPSTFPGDQQARLLLLWLLVEFAAYFFTTPFAAVRRTIGIYTVAVFFFARAVDQREQRSGVDPWKWRLALSVHIVLALLYYAVDAREACAAPEAVHRAIAQIPLDSGVRWYVGHWGLQYHAEQAGLHAVIPGSTRLHVGDWLLVPEERYDQQWMRIEAIFLQRVTTIQINDGLPWQTMPHFYWGSTPLVHQAGPRLQLSLYHVVQDFTAEPHENPPVGRK